MAVKSIDIKSIRESLKKFNFSELFIEQLGWNRVKGSRETFINISGKNIPYFHVAELNGVYILKFEDQFRKNFEKIESRKKLHKKIEERHAKHLIIFSDDKSYLDLSYFSSKDAQVRTHTFFKDQNGDTFIRKLCRIHVGIEDDDPTIKKISEMLEKAFDTEKVTNKFYKDFKSKYIDFQKYISGIKCANEKAWYSSIILNRLMFIYFLQEKGFIDNDDNYLKTKFNIFISKSKSYYSGFLKILFFEGFAKKPKERSRKAKEILGDIKYLNGGLFVPHSIEEKYGDKIEIHNEGFTKIFEMFSKYEWCSEYNKGGNDNELNPDVLGYIFEKYIIDSQKKNKGAYYTRDEITSYLSRMTIQEYIVEQINKKGGYSFKNKEELLHNLDVHLCKMMLTSKDSVLNTLTILDPAVGSGAFLISAMKELIDIYSPIIGRIETLNNRDLHQWYDDFKEEHKSVLYGIKKNVILKNLYGVDIMNEAVEVCKLRLFLSLASSALEKEELEPLPNIDFNIMHGNSLVGLLKEEDSNKQLSLFGESYPQIKKDYQNLVNKYKTEILSFQELKQLKVKILNFIDSKNEILIKILSDKCQKEGVKYEVIGIDGKKVETRRSVEEDDLKKLNPFHWDFVFDRIIECGGFDIILTNPPWEKLKLEDKEFLQKYDESVKKNKMTTEELKIKKKELLEDRGKRSDYIDQKSIYKLQSNYFKRIYQYQSGLILNPNGKHKQSSSDMDTYRLFTERCFCLLKKSGKMGIVLPSGLGKDDGAIALRRFMLEKIKIEGLIDFQNQGIGGKIFEGVTSSFTFGLLNVQKTTPQDEFPCQFGKKGKKDLEVLERFPKEGSMIRSVKKIKETSPRDCSIVEFKDPIDEEIFLKAKKKFPELGQNIEGTWNSEIYREFDESDDEDLFSETKINNNYFPLYKGRVIWQYEYNKGEEYIRYVDRTKVKKKGFAFKNKCYKDYRLVIRVQASNINERTLISAIMPKRSFFSNSLNGVSIHPDPSQMDSKYYMFVLESLLNSFVVDYFIRQRVSSNVNQKFLEQLSIPRINEDHPCFQKLVRKSALLTCIGSPFNHLADEIGIPRGGVKDQDERWKIQAEIDALVAHIYGLTQKEFEHILGTFTTGKNQTRLNILKKLAIEFFLAKDTCLVGAA